VTLKYWNARGVHEITGGGGIDGGEKGRELDVGGGRVAIGKDVITKLGRKCG